MKLEIHYEHPAPILHCVNKGRKWEKEYPIEDGLVHLPANPYCPFCMQEAMITFRTVKDG